MSSDKRKMIEEKLELEKVAKSIANARKIENIQFVNFQKNPFGPDNRIKQSYFDGYEG